MHGPANTSSIWPPSCFATPLLLFEDEAVSQSVCLQFLTSYNLTKTSSDSQSVWPEDLQNWSGKLSFRWTMNSAFPAVRDGQILKQPGPVTRLKIIINVPEIPYIIISLMAAACNADTEAQLKDHVPKLSDRLVHFQHSAARLAMHQVYFHTLTVWHAGACQVGVKKLATLYWNCMAACLPVHCPSFCNVFDWG